VFTALFFIAMSAFAPAAEDVRTWSDSMGKIVARARFVALDGGKVTLRKEDGDTFETPLSKLSLADQTYVREAVRKGGTGHAPRPPLAKKEGRERPEERRSGAAVSGPPRTIPIATRRAGWSIDYKPESDFVTPKLLKPVRLPRTGPAEHRTGFALSRSGRLVATTYEHEGYKPNAATRVVLADLEKGEVVVNDAMPGLFTVLAVAEDGRLLVRKDRFASAFNEPVEVWSMGAGGPSSVATWVPYDDQKGQLDRTVKWAVWLDSGRVLTLNGQGRLVVWEVATRRALAVLPIAQNCTPGLSPDGRLLAFNTDKEVGIADLDQGEVLALQAAPNLTLCMFAFSADGARFACICANRLYVWELPDGKLYREIGDLTVATKYKAAFPGRDYVLLGDDALINLDHRVPLWQYQGADAAEVAGTWTVFLLRDYASHQEAVVPARLPHAAAEVLLKRAGNDPNLFALKTGTPVTVDVAGVSDTAHRDEVAATMAAKLKANGNPVDPKAAVRLVASTAVEPEREVAYRTMLLGGPKLEQNVSTFRFRDHRTELRMIYQGKTIWETGRGSMPMTFAMRANESVETFLKQYEAFNYDFFKFVDLPKLVLRPLPKGRQTLGASKITAAGVK
jgi:hypothetical protein